MPAVKYGQLPFNEAIDYFRQKVNLPSKTYADLMGAAHARAFTVAGAMKNDLLVDFRNVIDKAISQGTTLAEFRKDFDNIVEKHGWSYNGSRGWRTDVIYHTNLRTAWNAGRWQQIKAMSATRPYLQYHGGRSENPRPLHLSWNGIILPYDDPWWKTHFTPNGWGCKCKITSHSGNELARKGWEVSSSAPNDGNYEWKNPATGEAQTIPNGIDPGWDYNPGEAAGLEQENKQIVQNYQGGQDWERLPDARNNWTWADYERPEHVPADQPESGLDRTIPETEAGMANALNKILDGEGKLFSFQSGDFRYDINVNAKNLAKHIAEKDPKRARFLPLLKETMENPYEVWLSFEKNKLSGKVVIRQRIIKLFGLGKEKGVLVVANSVGNQMEALTMFPSTDPVYLNKQRVGKLIWKR